MENGNLAKNQHVWVHGLRHRFATDKLKEISQLNIFVILVRLLRLLQGIVILQH